jgi:hypothetical protein
MKNEKWIVFLDCKTMKLKDKLTEPIKILSNT